MRRREATPSSVVSRVVGSGPLAAAAATAARGGAASRVLGTRDTGDRSRRAVGPAKLACVYAVRSGERDGVSSTGCSSSQAFRAALNCSAL